MIAQYPPMGWNSWDCYGPSVTEENTQKNADYMAKYLKEYGWEYVVVDIQWSQPTALDHDYVPFAPLKMDDYGRLIPAENRFPSAADGKGFRPLADYIHSLGLKFGIHIMRGLPRLAAHNHLPILGSEYTCADAALENSICQWNGDMYGLKAEHPAARAYYESIFALYAEWGVDYVKVDDIAREYPHCEKEIELISDVVRHCGRDIVLSLSPGPAPVERAEHLKKYANMWRITDDFWDKWPLLLNMFERAEKWCLHAGPGHWPDADMLPIGALCQNKDPEIWTHFTHAEQRTMMTLWCMMRSPLMIGAEMTKNDDFTLKLLTNGPLLEIEKTTHCAHPMYRTAEECAWIAPRQDGEGGYIALFNLSDEERELSIQPECWSGKAKELWTEKESAPGAALTARLKPHDAAVWKVERK
ncbi:MAG: glycoside hydrolase family 27 protein [Clostridiales bacterium]|nr:glycoside hydrolase family 27 protein [Clostridiales bacterium]